MLVHGPGMGGIYSNQSYRSSSALKAHLGMGTLDRVDLAVTLPGGRRMTIDDVKANRYLDLDRSKKTLNEVEYAAAEPVAADSGP